MVKFGTGGWRAVIGDDFTRENICILAKAMCVKMKREGVADKGIVIGYDRRFLAKEAMRWAAQVFAAEGIKASLINKSAPTPLVMFYVMRHELPYGMMVTASHNPALYNGIKVFTVGGRDANEEQTGQIEEIIAELKPEDIRDMEYEDAKAAGLIEEIYPLNEYLDNIIDAVDMKAIRDANLKIALDPMYTLRPLQNFVLDAHCDIGIATDGDADRLGVIDDTGRFLHPNDILVLLYYYLVKYKGWRGPVVRNICTTHLLDRIAEKFGEKCYEVPVGFKHISAKMEETDAVIGGESSGGLTVRGHIKGKDGVYAASLLVEMLAVTGRKLSEIYADVEKECGSIFMEECDYRFTQEKKVEVHHTLMEEKKVPELPFEVDHVSYLDGCKVYFKNGGWVVARFSGTEPLIRIFCEMPTAEEAKTVREIYENFLELGKAN